MTVALKALPRNADPSRAAAIETAIGPSGAEMKP